MTTKEDTRTIKEMYADGDLEAAWKRGDEEREKERLSREKENAQRLRKGLRDQSFEERTHTIFQEILMHIYLPPLPEMGHQFYVVREDRFDACDCPCCVAYRETAVLTTFFISTIFGDILNIRT